MFRCHRSQSPTSHSPGFLAFALVLAFAAALLPDTRPARAGSNLEARLAVHLLPTSTKNACGRAEATPACPGIVTNGSLYPSTYFAYLLITNGDAAAGLAGLQCGVSYDGATHSGVDIISWNLCATLQFPSGGWPASGSGNLITWDSQGLCQRTEPGGPGTGVVANAGYFYLAAYSPDALQLTVRPVDAVAKVADCSSVEAVVEGNGVHHVPSYLGYASFSAGGAAPGYNPCSETTTTVDCTISGPDTMVANSTGNIFTAAQAPPGSTFQWATSGNGSIAGSATGSSVSVTAGTGGTCTVYVTVTASGGSNLCSRTVTIGSPVTPECSIGGPDTASEGNPDVIYTLTATGPYTSVSWSITGDGLITSSLTAPTVHVQTGDPGAFELTATLHGPGANVSTCMKTVTITTLTCFVAGNDPVLAHTSGLQYTTGPARIGGTYLWQITGNGSIQGSATGPSVLVNAGAAGAFELTVIVTRNGQDHTCQQTVTVLPNGGGANANANAKILVHLLTPTMKNACGTRGTPTCSAVLTAGALYPTGYYAYLVVMDGDANAGIGGFQCGIDYDAAPGSGVDIFSWTLCASTELRSTGPNGPWPAAGSGNLITWFTSNLCQRGEPGGPGTGVAANAGYFYCAAYSPGILRVTPRPDDGKAKVADCAAGESLIGGTGYPSSVPSHLGYVSFSASGQVSGYNPCGAVYPVRITTWSSIKGQYAAPAPGAKPRKP